MRHHESYDLPKTGMLGLQSQMTRRTILQRAAVLGSGMALSASLLSACGGEDDDPEPTEAAVASTPEADDADESSTDVEETQPADSTPEEDDPVEDPDADSGSSSLPDFDQPDRSTLSSPQRFTFAGLRDPDTLDVNVSVFGHVHRILSMVYEPLVFETRDFEFVPGLAEAWEISDDGLTYTFTLREGVTFHDDTPFNAEAVKFAFDRIVDPATQSRRAINLVGPYQESEVVDDYTVTLILSEPYAAFLDGISYTFCGIPSPTAIQTMGEDFGRAPVATGPMMVKEWIPQDSVVMEKYKGYNWASPLFNLEGEAYLDEFIYRIVPEEGTRAAVLETGEVDLIDSIPAQDVARFQDDDRFEVILEGTPGIPSIYMLNTERPPLDDILVRQALIYAVDRDEFSEFISYGTRPPAYGPLAATTFGYNPEIEGLYTYDPERAAELLDEAGWVLNSSGIREKDGEPLELDLLTITTSAQHEYLQAVYRDLGITVNILTGTDAWWQEAGIRGEHHLLSESVSGSDPSVLSWHFHSQNIADGFARTRFADARLDELLDLGDMTSDVDERREIYAEVQQIIMENALVIPILEGSMSLAMHTYVKNVALDARVYYTWMHSMYLDK